jgi:NAD-dependent deacetylase
MFSRKHTEQYDFQAQLSRAQGVLRNSKRVAILTGAGVSADSGIPTFRDNGGFWTRFPPSQFANWANIVRLVKDDPKLLAEFAIAVFKPIATAQPNLAHASLAAMESRAGKVSVITQNIDGLHQRAGSSDVIEIHGSAFEIVRRPLSGTNVVTRLSRSELRETVAKLESFYADSRSTTSDFLEAAKSILGLSASEVYHPNIVLFGDLLPTEAWHRSVGCVEECDCMLVVGTSQLVVPAATLPTMARSAGAVVILIDPLPGESDIWLLGTAGDVLADLLR